MWFLIFPYVTQFFHVCRTTLNEITLRNSIIRRSVSCVIKLLNLLPTKLMVEPILKFKLNFIYIIKLIMNLKNYLRNLQKRFYLYISLDRIIKLKWN